MSGCLVQMVWQSLAEPDTILGTLGLYGLFGSIFAAGVLSPYVRRTQLVILPLLALVVVSGVSFYAAGYTAAELSASMKGPRLPDFVKASLVGAGIVFVSLPLLWSFKPTWKYAIVGMVAAIMAGIIFGLLAETNMYGFMLGFAAWHIAIAAVLHVACPVQSRDGWLASLPKRRLQAVVAAISLLVIVPLADDAVGAAVSYRHASSDGGLRVHEPVTAHGFRDERRQQLFASYGCGFRCVARVQDGTYAFQEYPVDHEDGNFVVFFHAESDHPNCRTYSDTWNPPIAAILKGGLLQNGRCLAFKTSERPIAEYAVRDSSERIDALLGLYALRKTNRQVIRLSDDKVVSETTTFVYDSRFLNISFGELEAWKEFLARALPPATGTPPTL